MVNVNDKKAKTRKLLEQLRSEGPSNRRPSKKPRPIEELEEEPNPDRLLEELLEDGNPKRKNKDKNKDKGFNKGQESTAVTGGY